MSEYQYYEFLAMDRPLTRSQQEELRSVSSRAEITPSSFTVVYNYSDLRGDPLKLLERHFDVLVYVANWGTHRIAFRLPEAALDRALLDPYLAGDNVTVKKARKHLLIDICSEDETDGGWEEGQGWMTRLAPVRAELLGGDLRALYLAWLLSVEEAYDGELDPDAQEPQVPPGLGEESAAMLALAEFLRIDGHLVAAAAETSGEAGDFLNELPAWISNLPDAEKNRLLLSAANGKENTIGPELLRRYRADCKRARPGAPNGRRTVGELLEAAERRRQEAERKRKQRLAAQRRREAARAKAAQDKRLDALEGNEDAAWQKVESLASSMQQRAYDEAVTLLQDLQALAARHGCSGLFETRLQSLRQAHARKYSFIKRLQKAGLP